VTALVAGPLLLSAFLLLLLEPMLAKSILPTLGGTPMVWDTRLRGSEAWTLLRPRRRAMTGSRGLSARFGSLRRICRPMSWSALSSRVAMPFGQLSPRKSESRACYRTNVAAELWRWAASLNAYSGSIAFPVQDFSYVNDGYSHRCAAPISIMPNRGYVAS
jgi:hypothetical protein